MSTSEFTRRDFMQKSAALAAGLAAVSRPLPAAEPAGKIVNQNPDMDYKPLGKTGLMISACAMGGHWKRLDTVVPGIFKAGNWLNANLDSPDFKKNRHDVVSKCIEVGINYIDACTWQEVMAYAEALRGRREQMHLGFSWYQEEMRNGKFRTEAALLGTLENGMKKAGLDYVDLWRITMLSDSGKHTEAEIEQMMKALTTAKKQGKAWFVGFSSHDRPHIKTMIEKYPDVVDVVVTPYTAKTKELPNESMFDAVKKLQVGVFGIKPFASNAVFKGDSTLNHANAEEDDRTARLTLRYIMGNPAVTAPIPGLINIHQVENAAKAVRENRELAHSEAVELERTMDYAWKRLPADYQWLKDWEYV